MADSRIRTRVLATALGRRGTVLRWSFESIGVCERVDPHPRSDAACRDGKLSGSPRRVNPLLTLATSWGVLWAGMLLPVGAPGQAPPSPEDVLGVGLGERFTDVAGLERYFRALDEASDLVTLGAYGETPEGRPLLQAVITSPANRGRLDAILALNAELTDPETSEVRALEIASSNPAVVYLTYGIHGSESSSSEAAMWSAYDLAVGAAELAGVLDSLVIVMDPVANPDGRDRYVQFYREASLARANPNPGIRERRERWPGGRYNHYLFDLNRDWAWLSQPETRARVTRYLRHNPQVHVDFHEMGYASNYFFFPAGDPINPIYPDHVLEWGARFGDGNARAMDEAGLLYFTGQSYDLFYPGYGDSWPSLLGAVGMTYEQGGGAGAGRVVERPDGSLLSLADRISGHRVTGRATLRTAAAAKTELLLGFASFHREVDEGIQDTFLVPGRDASRLESLADLLRSQGIQVERSDEEIRAESIPHPGFEARDAFPAGTYRVRARQPRGRLASALLRPDNRLEATSSYDITAWSLPYAYGVEAHTSIGSTGGTWRPVEDPVAAAAAPTFERGSYGYLLAPSFSHMADLARFLELEGRALVMADSFSIDGTAFPRGTFFFPRGRNPDLDALLEEAGLAGRVVPIASGRTVEGPDLGTDAAAPLRLPRLALLGGEGTSPPSFGAHWFFLERILDVPFDILNVVDATSSDLGRYDVIVLPSGSPRGELGDDGLEALESWIRAGGTLVAIAGSARALAEPLAGVEEREKAPDQDEEDSQAALERALRTREERELEDWMERTPGAILQVSLDRDHPLAFGAEADGGPGRTFVLSSGFGFEPSEDFESVAFFPSGLERTSGVISEGNLERLARSAWLVEREVGAGKVTLFADDPLFRLFWFAGFQLLSNALLVAPAF